MYVLGLRVDGIRSTHLTGQCQLRVINIGGHHSSSTQCRTYYCSHAHHTASNDYYHIDVSDLRTTDSMESYGHRFYQRTNLRRKQTGGNNFLPRQCNHLAHCSIALYAQCLVVLTCIYPAIAAGGTLPTIGIRIDSDHHAWLQPIGHALSYRFNNRSYLMTGDDRVQSHTITPHESIDVASAEADIA